MTYDNKREAIVRMLVNLDGNLSYGQWADKILHAIGITEEQEKAEKLEAARKQKEAEGWDDFRDAACRASQARCDHDNEDNIVVDWGDAGKERVHCKTCGYSWTR